jgi:ArsR family transcriptional regulator
MVDLDPPYKTTLQSSSPRAAVASLRRPPCYNILGCHDNYIPGWLTSQAMTVTIPDEFLDLMAEKFRMLADPSRLAILRSLMAGERNVSQVVEETGRNQANVSKHLKMLAEAGLLARRKEGLQVFYRLDDPLVERLCKLVCETIVEEVQEEMDRKKKLLEGWGGKAKKA